MCSSLHRNPRWNHVGEPPLLDRLRRISEASISLAKLAEAYWDAVAILSEAGRLREPNALYAVWASEIPGQALHLEATPDGYQLHGEKPFCSGLGLVNRALITVGVPEHRRVEIDLGINPKAISINMETWKTDAFRLTQTGEIAFHQLRLPTDSLIGTPVGIWKDQASGMGPVVLQHAGPGAPLVS